MPDSLNAVVVFKNYVADSSLNPFFKVWLTGFVDFFL